MLKSCGDMLLANEYGKSEAVFLSHIRTRY